MQNETYTHTHTPHFVCILHLYGRHIKVFHRHYQYSGKLSLVIHKPSKCWQMQCYTEMQRLYLCFCMYPAKPQNTQIFPCYSVPARSSHLLGFFPAAFGLVSHVHMHFRLLNFITQSIMHCSSNKWERFIVLPKGLVKRSFKSLRKPENSCWNMDHVSLLPLLTY